MIKDPYGRPVTGIRISVTQRCNLHCFYCHQEEQEPSGGVEMTAGETQRIVKVVAPFGITEVKMTGGEPLLRSDILKIVLSLNQPMKVKSIRNTTWT